MTQICPFFGLCGGCKHQNLTPTEYRQLKINFVQNILKNNKIEHEIEDFIEIPAHTRRRITLALENGVVGFNAHHSHQIIPVDKCPILTPKLEKLLPELQKISKTIQGVGDLAVLMTELGADITVKTKTQKMNKFRKKSSKKQTEDIDFLEIITQFCQQNKIARFIFNEEILYQICQLDFPANVFMQPSIEGEKTLVDLVLKGCEKSQHVLDLFCGLGTFTKPLANAGKKVLGIDITEPSILSLQKQNISARVQDLFRNPVLSKELNLFDTVVMDPARAGAKAQTEQLANSDVKKIIMVSCNSITFARDCKILLDAGYKIQKLVLVDQFTYSDHIEIVAYLEK
ncbi:MAG: class I SAM-dependent RNA methyltransferase [Alphaproteobacteria bacterium]|nr:class I SAM-dependent RNA methyltransferase [Alphaproteobacteria bacterium]